jgi:hypothetical protein
MKRKYVLAAIVSVVGSLCSIYVSAQDPKIAAAAGDKYVISAKAGGVNFVTGEVSVARKEGKSGLLLAGDELNTGDRVTTGADGKAEILLNPGSYLRVGGGASFEFVSTSLDDLKIKLVSGSAVLEVIAADDFRVSLEMPHSLVVLTRSGVFRLDVLEDGSSKLSVFKGKVPYGPDGKDELKSGRSVVLGGSARVEVSKFDTDARDDLDTWSRDRAKELTKLNAKLENKRLRNQLMNSYNQRGWNLYNSFGLWVYDASRRYWCFLPFGSGWGSPYGWGYSWDLWNIGMPYWVYGNPRSGWGNGRGSGSGNGNGNGNGSGNPRNTANPTNAERRGQMQLPPFQRIQNGSGRGEQDVVVRRRPPVDVDSPRSVPMGPPVMMPPSAPPTAPAPVPVVVDSKKGNG